MRKVYLFVTLLVLLCTLSVPRLTSAAESTNAKDPVLLLYDSKALRTPLAGNVEALQRLLAGFSTPVTMLSLEQYKEGKLHSFNKVILVRNKSDELNLPDAFLQDLKAYSGKYMQIGSGLPNTIQQALHLQEQHTVDDTINLKISDLNQTSIAVSNMAWVTSFEGKSYGTVKSSKHPAEAPYSITSGNYGYIPYLSKGNLSELAASYVLKDWLEVSTAPQHYVLISDIFPFSNLELVNAMADQLYEAGIPFVASIQPVFSNWDYPAMQRYMETLKHLQARNGSIIVQTPIVDSTDSPDVNKLRNELGSFLDHLARLGIVPLGVSAEMYWTYDKHYAIDGLSFFDSGLILPNQAVQFRDPSDTAVAFHSTAYTIDANELLRYMDEGNSLNPLPMNTAIAYSFPNDASKLETLLTTLTSSWTTFDDYKNGGHSVQTSASKFSSQNGHLLMNGQEVHLNNQIQDVDAAHVYVQQEEKSLSGLFSVQNKILIVLIGTTLFLFGLFLIIGHRMYKRKYMQSWRQ
ncbi:hypothetical protein [Paenibacillus sp. WC2504]|uniref:hypothetical protein n=1 Tax=Paenibacillus sp. WC2504 TaxID=3461403 RepID=UPI0040464FC7